jgi:hypothetical protein
MGIDLFYFIKKRGWAAVKWRLHSIDNSAKKVVTHPDRCGTAHYANPAAGSKATDITKGHKQCTGILKADNFS